MILCVGATPTLQRTLAFDRLSLDAVNRAASVVESASGKSINVALTLRTLGSDVMAFGFLGGDTGRFVRQDLSALDIRHHFIEIPGRTRTCITVIDRAGKTVTELVEESSPVDADAYDALLELVAANLKRARLLVLSGSLTPGAPQDFYARCTRLARTTGVPVILDGRGEPLRLALAERPDVIKPNRQELAQTLGAVIDDDDSLGRAIPSLLERGPRWAIVTNGAGDAMASDGAQFLRITPPAIAAVNPIGSGDAFAAGMAMAIVEGKDLAAACRLGAACGAANALDSPPGRARREDIERLTSAVRIGTW